MGRTAIGVLLGCEVISMLGGGEIQDLVDDFRSKSKMQLCLVDDGDTVGFLVAVGGVISNVPELITPVDLINFEQLEPFKKKCLQARTEWLRFSSFCGRSDVQVPAPSLFLVTTTVT